MSKTFSLHQVEQPQTIQPASVQSHLGRLRHWIPAALAIAMLVLAIVVLQHSLHGVSYADIQAHLQAIGALHLGLALLCTLASYTLLTLYDALALKNTGFPLAWRALAPTSFSAFAVGHNVGFATLSGGAIRFRAYSSAGLDATRIAGVVVFIAVTFFLGASLLLGVALLLEPAELLQVLLIPIPVVRAAGVMLIIAPLCYLLWSRFPAATLKFRHWQVVPPALPIAMRQLLLGTSDMALAALVMYLLLPADAGLSYLAFLGIYLLCLALATVSNVPGGLGVFEGAMLLLLPSMAKPELLGALLAYRVVYYLLPFAAALVLLFVQMIIVRRVHIQSVVKQGSLILTRATPQIVSGAVFIAGAALLFSGSLPGETSRLELIADLLPDSLVQASHLLGSVVGLGLLILARGLYRRLEGAFWLTLVALIMGILASLMKGFDYEEAMVLLAVGALLWAGRQQFNRPAAVLQEPYTGGWLLTIILVVVCAVWLSFFLTRHVQYSDTLWWNFAVDAQAPKMLRSNLILMVLLIVFSLSRLLRASPALSQPATAAEVQKAASIVLQRGSAESNVALTGDKRFLFHPEEDSFIMYQLSGRSAISMGDPVGNVANFESLVWMYREMCDRLDRSCVFYQVSVEHLPLYIDLGLGFSKLGEEAMVPLADFSLEGKKRAEFRQAKNRALRDGAVFEIVPAVELPSIIAELKDVSDQWLNSKKAKEKGFSIGHFDADYLAYFDIAIVRLEGKIVAFANLWQASDKSVLSIDLMRHAQSPLKGVMDYLFTEIMLWGKAQGFAYFSLGMAPLSGLEDHPLATLWHKAGNLLFRYGDEFYNFDGLRQYKQKFSPEWHTRYLAAPGGRALPRVLIDSTTLIAGGVKGVFVK